MTIKNHALVRTATIMHRFARAMTTTMGNCAIMTMLILTGTVLVTGATMRIMSISTTMTTDTSMAAAADMSMPKPCRLTFPPLAKHPIPAPYTAS